MNCSPGGTPLKLLKTIFQDSHESDSNETFSPKLILLLDMEHEVDFSTKDIPDLTQKMELAFPGIFPDDDSPLVHNCGGDKSGRAVHSFKDEIEQGTNIPHLLEHVILYLLSKCSYHCSAYCGQRSIDLEHGILTHFYLVIDYPSKLQAIVAVDLAMQVVAAWMRGKAVVIDPDVVVAGVCERVEPMVAPLVAPPEILVRS